VQTLALIGLQESLAADLVVPQGLNVEHGSPSPRRSRPGRGSRRAWRGSP
jgi:hypothetical protein